MIRDEHQAYIRSDLSNIMKEVVRSSNHLGCGMEFEAVNGYLLQSLFLQMTGAQEQKMKCICWELATDDLKYRYERYYKGWNLSECSTLKDKSQVYEDLVSAIKKKDSGYNVFADPNAINLFRDEIKNCITNVFENTNIVASKKKQYETFLLVFSNINSNNITPSDKLIFKNGDKNYPVDKATSDTELFAIYSLLYTHRNRCAHNTPSYQLNLPNLVDLRNENYQKYDNIFLFYAVLLMIDKIFRKLYSKYNGSVEKS